VLIADDYSTNLLLLEELLERVHLSVVTAKNGQEALTLCENEQFDIVILDIHMPQLDGYQATQKIRALPSYTDTPIIAVTASAFDTDEEKALESGMTAYLTKPLKPQKLYGLLSNWCAIDVTTHLPSNTFSLSSNILLLKSFKQDHHDDLNKLEYAAKLADSAIWHQTLHSHLGCSGNINARSLYNELKILQITSKQFKVITTISPELMTAFHRIMDEIKSRVEQQQLGKKRAAPLTNQELDSILKSLMPKLVASNFNLQQEMDLLTRPVSPEVQSHISTLLEKLEQFSYTEAIDICKRVQSIIK